MQAEKTCTNCASKYISPQPHSVTSFLFKSENHSDLKAITLCPSDRKVQSTNVNVSFRNDNSIGILSFFLGPLWMPGVFLSMLVFSKPFCFRKMYSRCAACVCVCTAAQAHLIYLLKIVLLRSVTYYAIRNLFSARVLNAQLFFTPASVAKRFKSFGKLRHFFRCPKLDLRLKLKHLVKKPTKFPSVITTKCTLSAVSTISVFWLSPELLRAPAQPGGAQAGWTCYRNLCWPDLDTPGLFQVLVPHYVSCTKRVKWDHVAKTPLFI